jgi:hypothetical protein
MTGQGEDWLLFLGAGASAVCPTHLPTFDVLSNSILAGLGWARIPSGAATSDGRTRWWRPLRPDFPQITTDSLMPPEVVFGTLHRFGVPFAASVEALMLDRPPNAVHDVAARVLAAGAPVWTPNVDTAVELSYQRRRREDPSLPALRRALPRSAAVLHPGVDGNLGRGDGYAGSMIADLEAATPSTLVKFHGSCDAPGSLAFTDLELLVPPSPSEAEQLAEIAEGRRLVFYGYAGADADLRDLLRACAARTAEVVWFEPNSARRAQIQGRFPDVRIDFRPRLPDGREGALAETAEAFLNLAQDSGLEVGRDLAARAAAGPGDGCRRPGDLRIPRAPEIVNARLVHRFGDQTQLPEALRAARREDLFPWTKLPELVPRAVRGHLRWMLSESLYSGGLVARVTRAYARQTWLLRTPGLRRPRDYALDKVTALMLADGDWQGLLQTTAFAARIRRTSSGQPRPNDRYYRAHALRYAMRITEAIAEATAAEQGLRGSSGPPPDAERLAGAILEQGILANYQGRFADALDRAEDLHGQRGRYAIRRWAGWGHWLAGSAHVYRGELADAAAQFDAAEAVFVTDPASGAMADVDIGRLMLHRAQLAAGAASEPPPQRADLRRCHKRVHDDNALVRCDIALAHGNLNEASRLLDTVRQHPSSHAAGLWCELGTAEIERRQGRQTAIQAFRRIHRATRQMGARWLQLQAQIGLALMGEIPWQELEDELAADPPQLPAVATTAMVSRDSDRVLWMVS